MSTTLHQYSYIALVALLCCVSSLCANAQQLTIQEIRLSTDPMTVDMQRHDRNNQTCAMVKVILPMENVIFEGNVVGEPLFKTNEYWVYLTPGTKMFNIKAPGHYPLMVDFRNTDIKALKSKGIYYIVLTSDNKTSHTDSGLFAIITISPTVEASVRIDGILHPLNENTVIAPLAKGQHSYRIEANGYEPATGDFNIETSNYKLSINLQRETPIQTEVPKNVLTRNYNYRPQLTIEQLVTSPLGLINIKGLEKADRFPTFSRKYLTEILNKAQDEGIVNVTRNDPTIIEAEYVNGKFPVKLKGFGELRRVTCSGTNYVFSHYTYRMPTRIEDKEVTKKYAASLFKELLNELVKNPDYVEVDKKFVDEHSTTAVYGKSIFAYNKKLGLIIIFDAIDCLNNRIIVTEYRERKWG